MAGYGKLRGFGRLGGAEELIRVGKSTGGWLLLIKTAFSDIGATVLEYTDHLQSSASARSGCCISLSLRLFFTDGVVLLSRRESCWSW
jgi:hypothetical protein